MLYTKDQIKEILWSIFTINASDIKYLEQVGDEYWYEVTLENDITLDTMNKLSEDLYESDIFDVVNKGKDKLIVKYTGEADVLSLDEMRALNEKVEPKKYVEFDDSMIKRNKTLYSFLPNNVANSPFVQSVYNKMLTNKKLTVKQWEEFKYILDNGKSKYNNNKLTTKN